MKSIRDIANLDHSRHAINIFACAAHVNATAREDKDRGRDAYRDARPVCFGVSFLKAKPNRTGFRP
jgi:hypothetical protein